MVARYARVPLEQVKFKQRHSYVDPAVLSLEVEGRGLFFATDVDLDFDEMTYVVPYSEQVKTPSDVHRSCQAFLARTGRAVS